MKIAFTVLGTPIPKARARVVAGGRAFTPERTSRYEKTVGAYALQARLRASRDARWPLDARYSVEIAVYRKRDDGDIDNLAKSALDGCNGVVWDDDRQVKKLTIERFECDVTERMEITVETREAPPC